MSKDKQEWEVDIEPPFIDGPMFKELSRLPHLQSLELSGWLIYNVIIL